MTLPTKAQIDALFAAHFELAKTSHASKTIMDLEDAYLAAGLNADGSEKAKVVRAGVYLVDDRDCPAGRMQRGTWDGTTFTPDKGAP